MEKEKSVLTEADKKEIINNVWDRKVGCADTEYIMRETEQKVLANLRKEGLLLGVEASQLTSEQRINMKAGINEFIMGLGKKSIDRRKEVEAEVLANYKKGLREKAKIEVKESNKERERANKENLSSEASFFEGRISAFCWLLKELGEK